MTQIILTRHGHVDWIAPERFRGRAELSLSELGKRQATALGARIARSWKPCAIYASPLLRCVHTAQAIAQTTGASVQTLSDLLDTDYGQWQGRTHQEVEAHWPQEFKSWFENPDLTAFPDGETLAAVLVRSTSVLRKMLAEHPDDVVVLVGHDSINRVILLHALGLPLSHYWRIKQDPCCVNEIRIESGKSTLNRINETFHLIDAGT
ncbi:Phosphoglyceromutase [Achromobacter xylosoxidans]|uniref:histidine phosphatase family protein n=1 Tax=Alcaligenes xylosoxydans xylosoxydans TaxID=85698 RepID=UPI0006C3F042|nr:histidine phosphatase family protein [Achromobacter xylosoxidans]CUJ03251.1 Phosphoglyceromutase [Achromobacter xylosoxidans]CUJ19597.1 Phosphoglyceromutase [Achromobacter xylosoxidans]